MKSRVLSVMLAMLLVVFVGTGCKSKSGAAAGSAAAAGATSTSSPTDTTATSASDTASSTAGPCPSSNTTSFAKTKFVLHTGLAFGAFHRYLYKPYQAGSFNKGASGRITAFVKAGVSALFIEREVRLAFLDVQGNPTLCKLVIAPLQAVGNTVKSAVDKLKGGDPSGITSVQSSVQSVESQAASTGDAITEDPNAPLS
jgi:hypothetical protein